MNKPAIGLTFSGGGYRAATFDLGVLSFLNSVTLDDGGTLLDCVVAMSSVSGGTIPAMKYMLAQAQKQPVDEMIIEVFDFLCENDLVSLALGRMSEEKANPKVSLIRIMADIYDEHLFGHKNLGEIMDNFTRIHVKDYTALATDFSNALPFRFRVAEYLKSKDGKDKPFYVFGNNEHRINLEDARWITMGEAMACSSCFPGAFEPMMFPEDFKFTREHREVAGKYLYADVNEEGDTEWRGFGIMDGGITDNEGIESILKAEERRSLHYASTDGIEINDEDLDDECFDDEDTDVADSATKSFDLIIISDVSSPYIKKAYAPHDQWLWNWLGKLTVGRLGVNGLILSIALFGFLVIALMNGSIFWTVVTTGLFSIVTSLLCGGAWLKTRIHNVIAESFIGNRARFINHMKFAVGESMLMNRATSVLQMSSEVFLKRQRQLNYDRIHNDLEWKNRRISNLVYELRDGKRGGKKAPIDPTLKPNAKIQRNSAKAADMGTTLWFTDEDKQNAVPQALLAAGQYTVCYNLIDYIDRIKRDSTNLSPAHATIIALRPRLRQLWEKFQEDPHWMIPEKWRIPNTE